MYRDYSKMSASGRKSASKAAQSRLDSVQVGSDSGSVIYEGSAKCIGEAVNEYCRNTLVKLKQTEEMVRSLQNLGENIQSLNDEKKVLDATKGIYETIADTQRILDTAKIETRRLGITIDDLMSTLRMGENPRVADLNEKKYSVSFVGDLDISHETDGYSAYHIYSTQSMEDGRLIMADYWNQAIKLIDSSQRVSVALKCRGYPWGLCKIRQNEFAVTLTDAQRIQVITVNENGTFRVSKDIPVDEPCRGIYYHKDNIYVACAGIGNEGQGHLRIITMDGTQTVIKDNKSGKQIFSRPRQVFVNSISKEVFVTDADDVKVLDLDGNEIRRIKDKNLKSPFGIGDDGRGGLLVSGFMSHNVLRLDQRNKQFVQVTEEEQINSPVSLFLHPKTETLFVGMERNKNIKCFSVTK